MMSLLVLTAALAACSDSTAAPSAPAELSKSYGFVGIAVSPKTVTLAPGGSIQLVRKFTDSEGTLLALETTAPTWTSLSPKVATVDATGFVKGVAVGTAKIVANQWNMYADTAFVTVQSASAAAPAAPAPAIAKVTVAASATRVYPTEKVTFTATAYDAKGKTVPADGLVWTSSAPGVLSVGTDGAARAQSYGSATVTATVTGGRTASATVTVAGGENEPSGMTELSDRAFGAFNEDGWDNFETSAKNNFKFETDPTAPRSGGSVLSAVYQAGFVGGTSPAVAQKLFANKTTYKELYVSFWMKFSSNWQGHMSGVNKILHLWVGGANRGVVAGYGSGANPLQFQMRMQGIPDTRRPLVPNKVPAAQANFTRGQWQHVEVYLKLNTPGQKNGIVRWYLDGKLIGEVTDYEILKAGENWSWDEVQWSPTWGGGDDKVKSTQKMSFDHMYISVR